mmetsp:Transcript_47564/g.123163  ORF Transcript_47564/g.123163 Transcript_47564/m.123163 type:complete len:205 (-) Transcript_47564:778-1392(-)
MVGDFNCSTCMMFPLYCTFLTPPPSLPPPFSQSPRFLPFLNNLLLFANFDKCIDCVVDLLGCVCRAELHANAGLTLRHDRVAETNDVHPPLQHCVSKLGCQPCVSQHDGRDRMTFTSQLESSLLHSLSEQCSVGLQFVTKLGGSREHFKHLQGSAGYRRCQSIRKEVRSRLLSKHTHHLFGAGGVATCSPAKRLPEGGVDDVHL